MSCLWRCSKLRSVLIKSYVVFPSLSIVLNCVRLLTRVLPFLFEAPDWRLLFWSPANFIEVNVYPVQDRLCECPELIVCPEWF